MIDWRKPFGLAVLLAALGALALWVEYKHKPEQEEAEEADKKVFAQSLKEAQIRAIRIRVPGKSVELSCHDDAGKLCKPGESPRWELEAPLKTKADDSNGNAFVSTLNNLSAPETIDLREETPEKRAQLLKDYGLAPEARGGADARAVELRTDKGTTVLYLGGTHPIGETIFSVVERVSGGGAPQGKPDDARVYLLPTYFKNQMEHDLTYWRDKKLLNVATADVASFQLSSPKGRVSVERKDNGWVVRESAQGEWLPGDVEGIDTLVSGAAFLNAKGFAADDKSSPAAKQLLRGAKPTITFALKKLVKAAPSPAPSGAPAATAEEEITLSIFQKPGAQKPAIQGKPAPGTVYAIVSNQAPLFDLDPPLKDRFEKSAAELRMAKLITSMDRFTAKTVEFSGKPVGAALAYANQDGKWVEKSSRKEADNAKMQGLLDKLSGNRIQEFIAAGKAPSGQAEGITVALLEEKPEPKRKIVFWKAGDKVYARDLLSQRPEVFRVDPALKDALPWEPGYFDVKPGAAPAPAAPPAEPADPHGGHGHAPGEADHP